MNDFSSFELESLLSAADAVLRHDSFEVSSKIIFDEACKITGATSGYIALLSDDGMENEVLFLEAGGLPCTVDPKLPMPIRGLRAESYRHCKVVFDNDFMNSQWVEFMPDGHVTLKNVMFAPLVIEGRTVGIMGLANKPDDFTERDASLAMAFGHYAAMALRNSRNLDKINEQLQEINTLREFIPMCAWCRKVRTDDEQYWQDLEQYVSQHLNTEISHGICPECAEKLKLSIKTE